MQTGCWLAREMNGNFFARQTKIIALSLTLICSIVIGVQEVSKFNIKMQSVLLPSVRLFLERLAMESRDQLQFLKFNSEQNTQAASLKNAKNISNCLSNVEYQSETNQFTLLNQTATTKGGGNLYGNDNFPSYSFQERKNLCHVILSSRANLEFIRLNQKEHVQAASYSFISRFNHYTFIYKADQKATLSDYFSEAKFVRDSYRSFAQQSDPFWVLRAPSLSDETDGKLIFIQNVENQFGNTIGFFARSFNLSDLRQYSREKIWNDTTTRNLLTFGQLVINSQEQEIYRSGSTDFNSPLIKPYVFQADNSSFSDPEFKQFTIHYEIPYANLVIAIFDCNKLLLFIPFIVFFGFFYLCRHLLLSLKENDKQNYDAMTKVLNRQGLINKVKPKVQKKLANNQRIHILALDANEFKLINDKYGHDIGDKAINVIARSAEYSTREDDDVIRLGGDEFLVLLYTSMTADFCAQKFIRDLNRRIGFACKKQNIPRFNVSYGYFCFDIDSHISFENAMREADHLLVQRKRQEKLNSIDDGIQPYEIGLTKAEQLLKQNMHKKLDFVAAEFELQQSLNMKTLKTYRFSLSYVMSSYFELVFMPTSAHQDLSNFRMNIVDSHHRSEVSTAVFFYLFTNFCKALLETSHLSDEERVVFEKIRSYEAYYISSLKLRS